MILYIIAHYGRSTRLRKCAVWERNGGCRATWRAGEGGCRAGEGGFVGVNVGVNVGENVGENRRRLRFVANVEQRGLKSKSHRFLRKNDGFLSSEMVGERGFEPLTFWSRTKRATRLRYSPARKVETECTVSGAEVKAKYIFISGRRKRAVGSWVCRSQKKDRAATTPLARTGKKNYYQPIKGQRTVCRVMMPLK